ncbi:MAG: hypothetical protein WBO48_03965, partial [Candidatus Promineifilaceae bacterium]
FFYARKVMGGEVVRKPREYQSEQTGEKMATIQTPRVYSLENRFVKSLRSDKSQPFHSWWWVRPLMMSPENLANPWDFARES